MLVLQYIILYWSTELYRKLVVQLYLLDYTGTEARKQWTHRTTMNLKCSCWLLLQVIAFVSNITLLLLLMQQFASVDTVQQYNNIQPVSVFVEDTGHKKSDSPTNSSNWCILVCVGTNLFQERQHQREYCRNKYQEDLPGNTTIQHLFVVGIPSYDTRPVDQRIHGQLATAKEIEVASALLEEQRIHGDLYITPHRDLYRDLSEKKLGLLKRGVDMGCDYIFKVDHEYCLNIQYTRRLIDRHETQHPDKELYIGNRLWSGLEHPDIMAGPRNETTPYYSGHLHGLSRGLASVIVNQDWTHSVLKAAYGTSSEDQNTGQWVQYASQVHGIKVDWVTAPKIRMQCRRRKQSKKT